jgi:hypothetical protein
MGCGVHLVANVSFLVPIFIINYHMLQHDQHICMFSKSYFLCLT